VNYLKDDGLSKNNIPTEWSQWFNYPEKNLHGQLWSAYFIFNSSEYGNENFINKFHKVFWDEKLIRTFKPVTIEIQKKNYKEDIVDGIGFNIHLNKTPYSKDFPAFFKLSGDKLLKKSNPRTFFKNKGFRSFELYDQGSLEYVGAYCFVYTLIDQLKIAFSELEPLFGVLDSYSYVSSRKGKDPREFAHGLTFYGKEMVEQIGKEKLLQAPKGCSAYHVEEIDHGGVMLQIHENPICKIPPAHRRKIVNYLGLKPKKVAKQKVPDWMSKVDIPSPVTEAKERSLSLVIGLNVIDIQLSKDVSFYDYVYKALPARYQESDVKAKFVIASWFNSLDLGLEAHLSGSFLDKDFEVFIGQKIGGQNEFMKNISQLDLSKIEAVRGSVAVKLKELGFNEEPCLNFLFYHFEAI